MTAKYAQNYPGIDLKCWSYCLFGRKGMGKRSNWNRSGRVTGR